MPSPIQPELVALGVFVFLGQLQPMEAIDYEVVLGDFDRLLALYEFVEGTSAFPTLTPAGNGFHFQAGYTEGLARTTANIPARELDVDLRHNRLRKALYLTLSQCYGADAVSSRELPNGIGGRIDTVVSQSGGYWFYEIKTALSARACIRDALAQLLEYAYWPGAREASRSSSWASLSWTMRRGCTWPDCGSSFLCRSTTSSSTLSRRCLFLLNWNLDPPAAPKRGASYSDNADRASLPASSPLLLGCRR
jgi:hypothetical protein